MGYSKKHDCAFDDETKEWVFPTCPNPQCNYCKGRPPNAEGVRDDGNDRN